MKEKETKLPSIFKAYALYLGVSIFVSLALLATFCYVVVHFLAKWW